MIKISDLGLTDAKAVIQYCREHICTECQGSLYPQTDYIRCIRSIDHTTFGKPYREPTKEEIEITKKRSIQEVEQKYGNEQGRAVTTLLQGAMTETRAGEIIAKIWPLAPAIDRQKAAMLCASYGLNPLMKHVFLIPFKDNWTLVMGISASRLIAQQQGDFSYIDKTPRVMTPEEQQTIFGEVDDSRIWAVVKLKNLKTGAETVGYGNWMKKEDAKGADKGNTKFNMACIRAERQALDRLCPGKLPQNVEVMDESMVTLPEVDQATGEIIEGEAKEIESPKEPAPEEKPPKSASGAVNDNRAENPKCPRHDWAQLYPNKWFGFSHAIEGEVNKKGKQAYCTWTKEQIPELMAAIEKKQGLEAQEKADTAGTGKDTQAGEKATPAPLGAQKEGQSAMITTVEDLLEWAAKDYQLSGADLMAILKITKWSEVKDVQLAKQLIKHDQEPPE